MKKLYAVLLILASIAVTGCSLLGATIDGALNKNESDPDYQTEFATEGLAADIEFVQQLLRPEATARETTASEQCKTANDVYVCSQAQATCWCQSKTPNNADTTPK
ncbi:MAG: hypothetical protein WA154_01405 [Moraxellaceae bacterium]